MDVVSVLLGSQLKLRVLLVKSSELINFANDDECEAIFQSLALFGKRLLVKEQLCMEETLKYESMDLSTLIAVAPVSPTGESLSGNSFSSSSLPERRDLGRRTIGHSSVKRVKMGGEGEGERDEADVEDLHHQIEQQQLQQQLPVQPHTDNNDNNNNNNFHINDLNQPQYWDFETNPNVVTILRFQLAPLIIFFTARPALMGNHVPLTVYADVEKLIALVETNNGAVVKSRQSKTALRRMKKGIASYSKLKPLSIALRSALFALPWASKSFRSKVTSEDDIDAMDEDAM